MNTKAKVQHTYLILFKGDDSDFIGNQNIVLNINTDLDLTGCKAHFKFLDFAQDFNEIPENKQLELVFPKSQTEKFPLGAMDAELWLEDSEGKRRTVSNRIHIVVTNSVLEAYNNEDTQAITVTIESGSGGIDPTKILEGVTMETNTLIKIREAIQTIGTALGATVTALAFFAIPLCHAATSTVVQTVDIRNVDLDSPVEIVTNVDFEALVDTNQLQTITTNLEDKISKATPGNYAAVSNAAMNALSRAEAEAGWTQWKILRDGVDVTAQVSQPTYNASFGTWDVSESRVPEDTGGQGEITDSTDAVSLSWGAGGATGYHSYTASRIRLPKTADIPTKTSDLQNDSGFLTQHQQLTPVRVDGDGYTDWVCSPATYGDGYPLVVRWEYWEEERIWGWIPYLVDSGTYEQIGSAKSDPTKTATRLVWDGDAAIYIVATRSRKQDVVGYTLGDQTNKVLAATNGLARASDLAAVRAVADAAATTNAQQGVLLSAIVDDVAQNSADIATVGAQVNAIGAHLNAEDAHFVSTNYDSAVRMPEAYVEIKMHDQATGSNTWITIWQEMRRWTAFVGDAFDWNTWSGFHAWATNITAELSFKADRCWGIYDSETGGYSPEGYTQISSSNILIAAGMAYQRTVTSAGSVWVLQCNQGVAHLGGDTNGFFRVMDGDGVVQFEIVKGDKQEVGCDADGLTLSGGSILIPYSIDASEHPKLYCGDDLYTWKAEDDPDCLCTVSWSGSSGAWVATATPKTPQRKMFFKGTYMSGGDTYIKNNAPVGMDIIILNGVKYYLGTATISGHTVLTLSTTAP